MNNPTDHSFKTKPWLVLTILILAVVVDQVTKGLVNSFLTLNVRYQLIDSHLVITHVKNTGAMLGLGSSLSLLPKVILLQLMPMGFMLYLLFRVLNSKGETTLQTISTVLIIGGGLGNLSDRIIYGSVTDFFYIDLWVLKTGICNMADVFITLGFIGLLWSMLRTATMKGDLSTIFSYQKRNSQHV